MGLNTYAVERAKSTNEVYEDLYNPLPDSLFFGIKLCGGLFNCGGNDSSSFRGKVYADLIKKITGEDLYENEIIPNKRVKIMASKLENKHKSSPNDIEIENLAKWFRVAANNKAIIYNWY